MSGSDELYYWSIVEYSNTAAFDSLASLFRGPIMRAISTFSRVAYYMELQPSTGRCNMLGCPECSHGQCEPSRCADHPQCYHLPALGGFDRRKEPPFRDRVGKRCRTHAVCSIVRLSQDIAQAAERRQNPGLDSYQRNVRASPRFRNGSIRKRMRFYCVALIVRSWPARPGPIDPSRRKARLLGQLAQVGNPGLPRMVFHGRCGAKSRNRSSARLRVIMESHHNTRCGES